MNCKFPRVCTLEEKCSSFLRKKCSNFFENKLSSIFCIKHQCTTPINTNVTSIGTNYNVHNQNIYNVLYSYTVRYG